MAGNKHQFILGLITKKIREDGFDVVCLEGKYIGAFGEILYLPPTVINHRPDVIGVNIDGLVCIGDAKTDNDINSKRTKEQISDYLKTELNHKFCKVIIGVPRSSKEKINHLLKNLGVINNENLCVLYVPDEIIND